MTFTIQDNRRGFSKFTDEYQSPEQKNNNLKILVTGASGFIGSRLLKKLIKIKSEIPDTREGKYIIRCLTRNKDTFGNPDMDKQGNPSRVEVIEGDLSNYEDCLKALKDVDVAFYLINEPPLS